MAIERIVSFILRAAELASAAIVIGVNGVYLNDSTASSWDLGRFIYTEVVAGIAILFSLLWLLPFSWGFINWPLDAIISILWWVVFGLLVNLFGGDCGYVFDWGNVRPEGGQCSRFKAVMAFAFISAILWLASALVGLFWVKRHERRAARVDAVHRSRSRWYRHSRV